MFEELLRVLLLIICRSRSPRLCWLGRVLICGRPAKRKRPGLARSEDEDNAILWIVCD